MYNTYISESMTLFANFTVRDHPFKIPLANEA